MLDYTKKPFYLEQKDVDWVKQTLSSMTTAEKLNQIFVDMLWNESEKEIVKSVKNYNVGGFRYNNQSPEKTWIQNAAPS